MYIKKYKKNGETFFMLQGLLGIDPATGKRETVTRRGLKSEKECELTFMKLKIAFEEGQLKRKSKKYTFKEVFDLWKEQYKNTVKESTLNKTLNQFDNYILPELGKYYIDMIKINHVQTAINKWFKVLKNYRIYLNYTSKVFKHAMVMDLIKTNPCNLVTVPKLPDQIQEDEVKNYYSKSELKEFLSAPELQDPKWGTLFRVLAFTGCRKGEVLALNWKDINFIDETITINKTLALGLENKLIIQTPKTRKSKRTIQMDPVTMKILKDWKSTQAKNMFMLGFNTLNSEQPVFTNSKNEFISLPTVGHKINSICKNNNLRPITTHGFRHTHCSILFEAGASVKEVQDRLGHSDIHTTMNIYTHVSERAKEETALKFANFLDL